eukprot:2736622-Karenia_brevis.AAC.1
MVAPVLLWGTETWNQTDGIVGRLDAFYHSLVIKMMGSKKHKDMELADFLHKTRATAKDLIATTTGPASYMMYWKQWSYMGHVVRNDRQRQLRDLLVFRNHMWWQSQQYRPPAFRDKHRKSGQQIAHPEDRIIRFLNAVDIQDPWQHLALNKRAWTDLTHDFASFWCS